MTLTAGTRVAHYEIIDLLGRGGMGAVYRALDTRLNRTVAIKVLQQPTAEFRRRFAREAKAIASLQHPHICTLHDVGEFDSLDYLVMEHVEGRTISGPLPLSRVVEYGAQIADALDAAHAKGVTHRDLKPANIMVTKSGIKVLDFGIASVSGDETLTSTEMVIGTPAYMAPEQRAGLAADARTDIYALGRVLVEMATARNDPVQKLASPALDSVVRGCLAEDRDDRWQSARDVRRMLQAIDLAPAAVGSGRRRWTSAGAVLLTGLTTAAAVWLLKPTNPVPSYHLSIAPPPGSTFLLARNREGGLALSPDGTMLAFVARTGARVELWIQRLGTGEARSLPGTERAFDPFWSPDSRQIAFYTPDSLKRVDLFDGSVRTIISADPKRTSGGSWISSDQLLITGQPDGAVHRVSVHGGSSRMAAANARWPHALRGGRQFVYSASDGIYLASLEAPGEPRQLVEGGWTPVVYSDGHLLFVRDRTLVARRFDPRTGQISEAPVPVAHSLLRGDSVDHVSFSATASGVLVYAAGETLSRLRWRERSGKPIGEVGDPAPYLTPRISPDGSRVAFAKVERGNTDVWTAAADGSGLTHLTFDPHLDWFPIWSRDGTRITFASGQGQPPAGIGARSVDLYRKAADGSGHLEQLTFDSGPQHPMDWSADGEFLLFTRNSTETGTDLKVLPASGTPQPYDFLRTPVSEAHSQFDPGKPPRWIAYSSDESGRREIYVAAFVPGEPVSQARWQISREGGTFPRWRGDGKELFYWGLDGRIMSVEVEPGGRAFRSSTPVPLFQVHVPTLRTNALEYDVTADGQRFLLIEPAEQAAFQSLTLLTDWRSVPTR